MAMSLKSLDIIDPKEFQQYSSDYTVLNGYINWETKNILISLKVNNLLNHKYYICLANSIRK